MSQYYTYVTATGRIYSRGYSENPQFKAVFNPELTVVEGFADAKSQYFDLVEGILKDKTELSLTIDKTTLTADGTDSVNISGIPVGTIYWQSDVTFVVDDGSLIFTTDVANTYLLEFHSIEHFDVEVTLVAT